MKATKYLAMAVMALAFAACSNDELASVAERNANGLRPVEFSTVVKHQTRVGQIYNDASFATIYMKTTGTFYAEDGTKVTNPSLVLTKSGSTWTYKVNGAETASTLYWPLESYTNTFQAWYYDGGATQGALNNKTSDLDAVGAYATHSSTDEGNNVALNFYHAVSKAEFKVKVLEKTSEGAHKVKVDVKAVCLHNVNFKTSGTPAYTLPTSTAQMGAFTVDGTSTRDLITTIPSSYEPAWVTQESAATSVGSLLVMPQTIAAVEDFSTTTWSKPYISVLAQVRIDNAGNAAIFPKGAGTDDYAWIALPLPADFTQMQAHHKYIFTLNFRNDALGRVDRDQNPNDNDDPSGPDTDDLVPEEDEGNPISEPTHSGFPLSVTVTEVYDFDEGGNVDVNVPTASASVPTGGINGLFSVSSTKQVYFSQGNLQASTTDSWGTWTFSFMEHQYSTVETNADNYCTENYGNKDVVSFFGWGTSGISDYTPIATNYKPCHTDPNPNYYFAYGDVTKNLYDESGKADWGYNMGTGWRTLTTEEWQYLFEHHTYGAHTVHSQNGFIILPDGVSSATGFTSGMTDWTAVSDENWAAMEATGAVFLPAAGRRYWGTTVSDVGSSLFYWSSTCEPTQQNDSYFAYGFTFDKPNNNYYSTSQMLPRSYGLSVRLVYNAN